MSLACAEGPPAGQGPISGPVEPAPTATVAGGGGRDDGTSRATLADLVATRPPPSRSSNVDALREARLLMKAAPEGDQQRVGPSAPASLLALGKIDLAFAERGATITLDAGLAERLEAHDARLRGTEEARPRDRRHHPRREHRPEGRRGAPPARRVFRGGRTSLRPPSPSKAVLYAPTDVDSWLALGRVLRASSAAPAPRATPSKSPRPRRLLRRPDVATGSARASRSTQLDRTGCDGDLWAGDVGQRASARRADKGEIIVADDVGGLYPWSQ